MRRTRWPRRTARGTGRSGRRRSPSSRTGRSARSEGRIRELSQELACGLGERVSFAAEFARVLPAQVLCELLGFPAGDAQRFVEWFGVPEARASRLVSERDVAAAAERMSAAAAYVEAALLDRVRTPRDDALSAWLRRVQAPPWQALEYLSNEILFLFFAGYVPVAHVLAAAARAPAPASGRPRPGACGPLARRCGRRGGPAARSADPVAEPRGAARRRARGGGDPRRLDCRPPLGLGDTRRGGLRPAGFRLDRPEPARTQLAFGRGPHHCLGAPLVRLQARVALETLLEPLARMRLAIPPVDYRVERTPAEVELDVSEV